ncbi:protein mono-ADP-ribosyltransferase PARP14-like [Dendronephthya gigantea]|uniref:protein mono-ADP-ribosyltransferase PARP14-like n=1 Tax=Dendronephthya gigantea TaxID=151771 RepID=UPI00106A4877|nr:protein mono-ADP-ribosyltransferase PARP14-like [Dendronephthya gigantea]XP_028403603.1 protein mono-ADP-ribosyltransferase PARP14-like [Dendronephthya gigantea]
MPLKKKLSDRLKKRTTPSVSTEDEYRKEHKTRFGSTLQSLVQRVTTKKRSFDFNAPTKTLIFLREIGFIKELKSRYPNVEVYTGIQDPVNGKLSLRGMGDEFDSACDECSWKLPRIIERSMTSGDKKIWDVMANTRVQEHVTDIFISKNIRAQARASETDKSIVITAMDNIELKKAKELLFDLIRISTIDVPKDLKDYSENENFQKFLRDQEKSMPLTIYFQLHPPQIELVGITTAVDKAETAIKQQVESMRIKKKSYTKNHPEEKWIFLEMYFNDIFSKERELLSLNASFRLEKQHLGNYQIWITCIKESFPECENAINSVFEKIADKELKFAFPDIKKLINGKGCQDELKKIQRDRGVYIKDASSGDFPRSATFSHNRTQECYDRYNYTTQPGVKLSCRNGRIENEKADVLVNSALANLNSSTACGLALQKKGGPEYTVDCRRHTNIPLWDIVCTTGGKLACKYVIHAVCGNWNKENEENSKEALRKLLKKIFAKCHELGVSTLAMPTIGAGKHSFPEDLVLEIIREEVEMICFKSDGSTALANVSIIIFPQKQSHNGSQSKNLSNSNRYSLPSFTNYFTKTATENEITIRFIGFKPNVDDAISDVKTFLSGITDKKSIENIGHILSEREPDLEQLSTKCGVSIELSLSAGSLTVQGLKSDVADFIVQFAELQRKHELELQKKKWLSEISQYVQWWYLSAGKWVSYDDVTNKEIEAAYCEDAKKEFDISINGENYRVNLGNKEKKSYTTGQLVPIERTLQGDQDNLSDIFPAHWDALPSDHEVHLVSLSTSSPEYKEILVHFETGFKNQTRILPSVTKIQRIQNPSLFCFYSAKKKSMEGRENEMRLFHGTNVKNTKAINANNFNRSFAGDNVGTKFGRGVYFSKDSSYSLAYCADQNDHKPNNAGATVRSFQMYVVKVLAGDYTKGNKKMKVPPSKNDPNNPNLLFDSVVDEMVNPSIFVIFQDHQCYPEYLITFNHT